VIVARVRGGRLVLAACRWPIDRCGAGQDSSSGGPTGPTSNDVARGRSPRAALRDGDVVIVGEPDCLSLQVKLG
jgi:hypothetical protein